MLQWSVPIIPSKGQGGRENNLLGRLATARDHLQPQYLAQAGARQVCHKMNAGSGKATDFLRNDFLDMARVHCSRRFDHDVEFFLAEIILG